MTDFKIIVAGGGPAGLAAAALLAKEGIETALISPAPVSDPRTVALMQPAMRLLGYLRISVNGQAAPLKRLRIVDDTGALLQAPELLFEASELKLDAFGWNIPMPVLTSALRETATRFGVRMIEDTIVSASPTMVTGASGQTYSARALLAADGRDSLLRRAAGIAVDQSAYGQSALTLTFAHSGPHNDTSTEYHTASGPFTTVPLPGNRSSLVWMEHPARAEALMALPDADLAAEIQAASHGELGRVGDLGPRKLFALAKQVARQFAAKRTYLIGEAGHVLPPLGAQGLNLSLRDAAEACDIILASPDPGAPEALDRYDRSRRRDALPRSTAVDLMNRSLLLHLLPLDGLRAGALAAASAIPPLRKLVMEHGLGATGQLPFAMRG